MSCFDRHGISGVCFDDVEVGVLNSLQLCGGCWVACESDDRVSFGKELIDKLELKRGLE